MQDSEQDKPLTIEGQPVTEDQVQAWADEAEAGYDPSVLRRRGRPRMGSTAAAVATLRLDPELEAALTRRVEQDHTTRSQVMRDALRAWLISA